MTGTVVLICNDLLPVPGHPAGAAGIRMAAIREGLEAHGLRVVAALPDHMLARLERDPAFHYPLSGGTVRLNYNDIAGFCRSERADVAIFTNYNYMHQVEKPAGTRFVYDLFAPKILENDNRLVGRDTWAGERERHVEHKRRALAKADVVTVMGAKKFGYAAGWVAASRSDGRNVPIVNMPMIHPVLAADPARERRIFIGGHLQPWTILGDWLVACCEAVLRDGWQIDLLSARPHAANESEPHPAARILAQVNDLAGVTSHQGLPFQDYVATLQRARVSLSLAGFSRERQFALPARRITSLAAGIPTISPPFEDMVQVIAQHRLGALFHPETEAPDRLLRLLGDDEVTGEPARRRVCAYAREHIAPARAIRPLLAHLQA